MGDGNGSGLATTVPRREASGRVPGGRAPGRPWASTRGAAVATALLVVATLAACGGPREPSVSADAPDPGDEAHRMAVTGALTMTQLDGATVRGTITVTLPAEGWMQSVRFLLDGAVVATVTASPFRVAIDTTEHADGPHVLVAEPRMRNGSVRGVATARLAVANAVGAPPPPALAPPAAARLTWAPPTLTNPITRQVGVTGGLGTLDTTRDYVLVMPDRPRTEALVINGGRNVVLVGGEIAIPHQGTSPTIASRRALYVANATGTVHVEGLLLHGDDLSEGIQVNAPGATLQIQNVAIRNVHARDQLRFSDNHPDVIQTWGSVGELRVDRLTGESDYQGLFFKADYNGPHGPVHLRNVNLRAMPTTRYQFWMDGTGGGHPAVTLHEVWVEPAAGRAPGKTVWPDVDDRTHPARIEGGAASWPTLPVTGAVRFGVPASGDFVPPGSVGIGYVSPGYGTGP